MVFIGYRAKNRLTKAIDGKISKSTINYGACDGIRTCDLLITNELHYHCATQANLICTDTHKKLRNRVEIDRKIC